MQKIQAWQTLASRSVSSTSWLTILASKAFGWERAVRGAQIILEALWDGDVKLIMSS